MNVDPEVLLVLGTCIYLTLNDAGMPDKRHSPGSVPGFHHSGASPKHNDRARGHQVIRIHPGDQGSFWEFHVHSWWTQGCQQKPCVMDLG